MTIVVSAEEQAMKFIVAQIGARRAYTVPAALESAGMLERFYTDVVGNAGVGILGSKLAGVPFLDQKLKRLASRRLPDSIREKTFTFASPSVGFFLRRCRWGGATAAFRNSVNYSKSLGDAMVREGFGNATHLYSMLGECGPLLVAAKDQGRKVVSEVYILLSTERILKEERRKFPSWEPDVPDYVKIRKAMGLEDVLLTRTDFAICPSDAVRQNLVEEFGFEVAATAAVPYGMDPELLKVRSEPAQRRILFAGTAELRKGIHYLAIAAEKLATRGHRYDFRVAGSARDTVANQKVCRHLTFIGRIPRGEMRRELATADVFVLPSLAEGSAEVTYEALACGIPVVTTKASGSVVRDGIDGRIVPECDPDSLADAVAEIVEDRPKRERMAESAKARAREYTWDRYGERLIEALKSAPV